MRTPLWVAFGLLVTALPAVESQEYDPYSYSPYVYADPYPHVMPFEGGSPSYISAASLVHAVADGDGTRDDAGVCRAGGLFGARASGSLNRTELEAAGHRYDYALGWTLTYKSNGTLHSSDSASGTGVSRFGATLIALPEDADLTGLLFEAEVYVIDHSLSPPDIVDLAVRMDPDICEEQSLRPLNKQSACAWVYITWLDQACVI